MLSAKYVHAQQINTFVTVIWGVLLSLSMLLLLKLFIYTIYIINIFSLHVYYLFILLAHGGEKRPVMESMWRGENTHESEFSPTVWALGTKLRSSGLEAGGQASTFTH